MPPMCRLVGEMNEILPDQIRIMGACVCVCVCASVCVHACVCVCVHSYLLCHNPSLICSCDVALKRVTKSFNCKLQCTSRVYEYLLPTYAFAQFEVSVAALQLASVFVSVSTYIV